jgi:hypothetical protein
MQTGHEIFRYGLRPIMASPDDDYIDIASLHAANGGRGRTPENFLRDPQLPQKVDNLNDSGKPALRTIFSDGVPSTYVHKYLALDYAEDLNVDLWRRLKEYVFGEHTPAVSAPALPPDLANDPIIRLRVDQLQLARRVNALGHEMVAIREEIGRGPQAWTIGVWFQEHGIKCLPEAINRWGIRARAICISLGYDVPKERVCNGKTYGAKAWPIEVCRQVLREYAQSVGRRIDPRY